MKNAPKMSEQEKEQTRQWIKNWEELGPILEAERLNSLSCVNVAEAIAAFGLAYKSARWHGSPRNISGLIEQQRWFMRGHAR